jgi:hypothetical protein
MGDVVPARTRQVLDEAVGGGFGAFGIVGGLVVVVGVDDHRSGAGLGPGRLYVVSFAYRGTASADPVIATDPGPGSAG